MVTSSSPLVLGLFRALLNLLMFTHSFLTNTYGTKPQLPLQWANIQLLPNLARPTLCCYSTTFISTYHLQANAHLGVFSRKHVYFLSPVLYWGIHKNMPIFVLLKQLRNVRSLARFIIATCSFRVSDIWCHRYTWMWGLYNGKFNCEISFLALKSLWKMGM